jgi:hypothetical protein
MSVTCTFDASSGANPLVNPHGATFSFAILQMLGIHNHVDVVLDLKQKQPNYTIWSTLFMVLFCKFGLLDHIDGSTDVRNHVDDIKWMCIDHIIGPWFYNTVPKDICDMIIRSSDFLRLLEHHL